MTDRRHFLKSSVAAAVIAAAGEVGMSPQASAKASADALRPMTFPLLPLGSVTPAGWLKDQVIVQAQGLSDYVGSSYRDQAGNRQFVDKEIGDSPWQGGSWPNTRNPRGGLYLDGIVPLDAALKNAKAENVSDFGAKAKPFVDFAVASQQNSGQFGPVAGAKGKAGVRNRDEFNWWMYVPTLRALAQWQEYKGDPKALDILQKFFVFMDGDLATHPLDIGSPFAYYRWMDMLYAVQWTIDRTQDSATRQTLHDLSAKLVKQGYDWIGLFRDPAKYPFTSKSTAKASGREHGVNNAQALKTAAMLYRSDGLYPGISGEAEWRAAFKRQVDTIYAYHGLAHGMFSCDELLAGLEPQQGCELCATVETMFSLEVGLATFGDAWIADRLEKIAYNILPGQLTADMAAHQYVGQANQIFSGRMATEPYVNNPVESNTYGLSPHIACCTANYHQGWPKLTSSLWMASGADRGLVAAIIAPSSARASVGEQAVPVTMTTETQYPFGGKVRYVVATDRADAVAFPFYFRVPGWAGATSYTVHDRSGRVVGNAAKAPAEAFTRVDRGWRDGDYVEMTFDMTPRVERGDTARNPAYDWVSVHSGPLLFALPLDGTVVATKRYAGADNGHTRCSDLQITAAPNAAFNVGLKVDEATVRSLALRPGTVSKTPFSTDYPVTIANVPAITVDAWHAAAGAGHFDYANAPPRSGPSLSGTNPRIVSLVPFGCTRLRVACMPSTLAPARNA